MARISQIFARPLDLAPIRCDITDIARRATVSCEVNLMPSDPRAVRNDR